MVESIKTMANLFISQIISIKISDIIDILFVAILFFYIIKFLKQRSAGQVVIGIALLFLLYILSDFFDLTTFKFIMDNIFQVGIIALLIVFQPELRSLLQNVAGSTISIKKISKSSMSEIENTIDNICQASKDLSDSKTGALIVIQRKTQLGDYIKSGNVIDANVSPILIRNLFFNKSPMHDGAVIINENRIVAAGCFLPLSLNNDIVNELGTRHRAAIGVSENSDCIVVVISEETGTISIANEGKLYRDFNEKSLKDKLCEYLIDPNTSKNVKILGRINNGKDKEQ